MFDSKTKPRKGTPNPMLSESEFRLNFKKDFFDPRFREMDEAINELASIAWKNYSEGRKSPITEKAGVEFFDPNYDLSIEWNETRKKLLHLEASRKKSPSKILIINGSPRSEFTCPGEMSKTYRLVEKAKNVIKNLGMDSEVLDLSQLASGYKKIIYPCKGCVSTAMPLCHWPCSCYPNHSLGQAHDSMAEIFQQWVSAHGIMIIAPVHWYQVPSPLKLMMDRLVCADGGNPDPTTTHGKDPVKAKKIELDGWGYPKHLAGRAFSVVVHGDSAGLDNVRRTLVDWLTDLKLIQASVASSYIGYYGYYADSHEKLDEDRDFFVEVETAAASLVHQIELIRTGEFQRADAGLPHPMQK